MPKGKNKRITSDEKHGYILDDELISVYAREYNLERDTAKRIIESVFELCKTTFIKNKVLNIRGFGLFHMNVRKKCRYKNNYTGQMEEVAMVKVVRFKPSRSLKMSTNSSVKEEFFRYVKKQEAIRKDLIDRGIIKKRK